MLVVHGKHQRQPCASIWACHSLAAHSHTKYRNDDRGSVPFGRDLVPTPCSLPLQVTEHNLA